MEKKRVTDININKEKLSTREIVRYNGPAENRTHGVYTITMEIPSTHADCDIKINMSLEALIQLQQRINAALQHMITH